MLGGSLRFEALAVAALNFARLKGCQFLSYWYVENMQIRSRDLLKPKEIYFVKWEHLSNFLKL